MEKFVRKLALWDTKTFKPILTHDELEPIMATLGFAALPAQSAGGTHWKEYEFSAPGCCPADEAAAAAPPPRPRFPFPRIDGLHLSTYRAFFDAVAHFLSMKDISVADHFHVRGMPLHRVLDRAFGKSFRWLNDEQMFVYREGTVDQTASTAANNGKAQSNSAKTKSFCIVSLKDVIVI